MDVRFEYVRDAEPALVGELAVDIDVPPRVDDRDDARRLAAQGVRVVGETLVFETLEQHAVVSCRRLGGLVHHREEHPIIARESRCTMFRVRPRLLLACAILLLLPVRLPAQPATATLFVEIEDATGGRLPGVTLTVRNQATAVERRAETTAEGTAVIPLLSAGDYRLAATLTGFRTAVIDRFHLEAGAVRTLRLVLQAGDVHETVPVNGDSAEIRAGSGAVGEVFSGQMLTMTPVASRDVGEYAWQAPGAAPPAPGSRLSGEGGTPVNVAGAREASNNFLLDGVDNNDLFLNRVLVTPSLDAVQEFTLITSTYDAQYGRSAGAQVNVVLKSGSERTSGSAVRVRPRPCARSTRRAGSAGPGRALPSPRPGRRHDRRPDRAAAELLLRQPSRATHDRSAETRLANVPSAAERAGDFQRAGDADRRPVHRRAVPGQSDSRLPNRRDRLRMPSSSRAEPHRRLGQLRLVSDRAGRHVAGHRTFRSAVERESAVLRALQLRARRPRSRVSRTRQERAGLRHTHGRRHVQPRRRLGTRVRVSTRSTTCASAGIGWRRDVFPDNVGIDGYAALGMTGPSLGHDDLGYPALSVSGLDPVGDDVSLPVVRRTNTLHVSDTVSVDRGRHFLKVGGELRHYPSDGYNHLFPRGQLDFLGAFTGNGVATCCWACRR